MAYGILISQRAVDEAGEWSAGSEVMQVLAKELDTSGARPAHGHVSRDVGCQKDVWGVPQRIICRKWLGRHHVECRPAKMSVLERGDECLLIDRGSTSDVDNDGALRQQGDAASIEDVGCLGGAGQGHGKNIGGGKHLVELVYGEDM